MSSIEDRLNDEASEADPEELDERLPMSATEEKRGINMDARRRIEQLREQRALEQAIADDLWD